MGNCCESLSNNNTDIGIHKKGSDMNNLGTLLKSPLNDFIKTGEKNNKDNLVINLVNKLNYNQNNKINSNVIWIDAEIANEHNNKKIAELKQ